MSFLSFIQDMAAKAGWKAVVPMSETLIRLPFSSDEGEVNVFIRPCGKVDGKTVIEFSSLGLPLPANAEARLGMCEAVLTRNGNLLQGYWAIEESNNEQKLTVMATQIAETMDPPEFSAAVDAIVAEYSKIIGVLRKMFQGNRVDF